MKPIILASTVEKARIDMFSAADKVHEATTMILSCERSLNWWENRLDTANTEVKQDEAEERIRHYEEKLESWKDHKAMWVEVHQERKARVDHLHAMLAERES